MTPYDGFVKRFIATMEDLPGVLISGYAAILLGRSRQTEDIAMFLWPMERERFLAWYARLEAAGFWCLNAGPDGAWELLREHLAPRFALEGAVQPNMEVMVPRDEAGQETLARAWRLDLLGVPCHIGDLNDQVAYKLYMATERDGADLPDNKDMEDALHIAPVAQHAMDQARIEQRASILQVPMHQVEASLPEPDGFEALSAREQADIERKRNQEQRLWFVEFKAKWLLDEGVIQVHAHKQDD